MTISALIIDDEQLARDELKYLLDQVGGVDVVAQGSNGIEAVDLIEEHHPDLVFLDVQMPGLDGFAVIKRLMDRHGREGGQGCRAAAADRVCHGVRPVCGARLRRERGGLPAEAVRSRARAAGGGAGARTDGGRCAPGTLPESQIEALLRLLNRPQNGGRPRASAKLIVQAQSRLLLVDQAEICFAAIDEGVIRVVTQGFEGQSKCRTLEELLELLDPALFWRAHRGFVVNINHIREVVPWFKSSYQLRMNDKKQTEIPVSRAQTRRLRELFNL